MATPTCSHRGCVGEAAFRPIWLLAFQDSHARHRICLDIRLCEEHRRKMQDLFCSRRGWLTLARALERRLRVTPDWTRSRISFQRVH